MIRCYHEIAIPVMSHHVSAAIQKRQSILNDDTSALRLFDGIGDGQDGFFLETYAEHWLVSTREPILSAELKSFFENSDRSVYWKHLDQHDKDDPIHIAGKPQEDAFTAMESGVKYKIHFKAGYSQGIFLDQRLNRQRVRKHSGKGKRILNTFAYTGAFSVCAALNGATTTTLDLSQVYLNWAKENFSLNNLRPEDHYFCKGDTFHWLKRFARQGKIFDGIILDPPTFSRDDKGKVFRVEKDYGHLVALAYQCLAKGGWILCCTNCRKLDPRDFIRMIRDAAPDSKVTSLSMPPEYSGEHYLKSIWLEKPA